MRHRQCLAGGPALPSDQIKVGGIVERGEERGWGLCVERRAPSPRIQALHSVHGHPADSLTVQPFVSV